MSKGRKRQVQERQRLQQQDNNKLEGERGQEELQQQEPASTGKREEAAALMRSSERDQQQHPCAEFNDNKQAVSVREALEKKQKMRANCCGSCLSSSSGQRRPIGGDEEEGDEANLAKKLRAGPLVPSWLIVLMVLALTVTAVIFAILAYQLATKQPHCHDNWPHKSSYILYSTKTTYSTAYNYLSSQNINPERSRPASGQAIDRNLLGGELPNIFNKTLSLASLHRQLVEQRKCRPLQLHFFGRHASRYPKREEITRLNKLIASVQNRIDLSKIEAIKKTSQINSSTPNATAVADNATNTVCDNPLTGYKQWHTFMKPDMDNSILDKGVEETRAMAERFKSIYPEMFDQAKATIEIGVTEAERTSQTALVFMKLFENFDFDGCDLQNSNNHHTHSSETTKMPQEPQQSPKCYSKIERLFQEKLQFHKTCREQQDKGDNPPTIIHRNTRVNESSWNEFIAKSVTKKLQLVKEDALSEEETRAIYDVCKYESAFKGNTSIWCSLFEDNELKFYEYRDDIDDFYNQAFGHDYQAQSACPVTVPMMESFEKASKHQKPSAYFYFTHAEVIQKILAASIDLSNDPAYNRHTIRSHLEAGTAPENRQWRTSLFTPFSANLAFTLYECPQDKPSVPIISFDTFDTPYKVVASLNEQPIKLQSKKCNDFVCDLQELYRKGRIFKSQGDCDLSKTCKDKIIIT